MKFRATRLFLLTALVAAAHLGCDKNPPPEGSNGSEGAYASSPFGRDLDRICHAEERSGALAQPEGARAVTVAVWLGEAVESQAGRDFLADLARTEPAQKGARISAAARKAGIDPCPLAITWGAATDSAKK